jgi:hypothetical protein
MSDTPVDNSKRTWLIASTCAGAVGAGFVATPFVSSFQPSERAKAAGAAVEVDISALNPGEKLTVEWRGKPVWIMKRSTEQLEFLKKTEAQLADPTSARTAYPTPEYAKNQHRSIILAKGGAYWIYEYLFAKQDRDNIDDSELDMFRLLAKGYEGLNRTQLAQLIDEEHLLEICHDP